MKIILAHENDDDREEKDQACDGDLFRKGIRGPLFGRDLQGAAADATALVSPRDNVALDHLAILAPARTPTRSVCR